MEPQLIKPNITSPLCVTLNDFPPKAMTKGQFQQRNYFSKVFNNANFYIIMPVFVTVVWPPSSHPSANHIPPGSN